MSQEEVVEYINEMAELVTLLLSRNNQQNDKAQSLLEQSNLPREEFLVLREDLDGLRRSFHQGIRPINYLPAPGQLAFVAAGFTPGNGNRA